MVVVGEGGGGVFPNSAWHAHICTPPALARAPAWLLFLFKAVVYANTCRELNRHRRFVGVRDQEHLLSVSHRSLMTSLT